MEGKNAFGAMPEISSHNEELQETGVDLSFEEAKDYFIEKDGEKFAGLHLIIDCLGSRNLSSLEKVEQCLRSCIEAAGATLLHIHLHHFTPEGGISGVAVLAESHISIHSWPEHGFAALDVFMCGNTTPLKTIDIIQAAFDPQELRVKELYRGKGALAWSDGLKKPSI